MLVSIGNFDASWICMSTDGGQNFTLVKRMALGCVAERWSRDSDKGGNVYVGEYGNKNLPNGSWRPIHVWKSPDHCLTWSVVLTLQDETGLRFHKIAVDPYTDYVWATNGDDREGIYFS